MLNSQPIPEIDMHLTDEPHIDIIHKDPGKGTHHHHITDLKKFNSLIKLIQDKSETIKSMNQYEKSKLLNMMGTYLK